MASVTIGRFVRAFSEGNTVSDKLVSKLDDKLTARTDRIKDLIKEMENRPDVQSDNLERLLLNLWQAQRHAQENGDNVDKSDLLEKSNLAAKKAIAETERLLAKPSRFDDKTVKNEVDAKLAALALKNTQITDVKLQKIAAAEFAALRERRGKDKDMALVGAIDAADKWTNDAIDYASHRGKMLRDTLRGTISQYLQEGRKLIRDKSQEKQKQGAQLIELTKKTQDELRDLEKSSGEDPRAAVVAIQNLMSDAGTYRDAQNVYQKAVVEPSIKEVKEQIAADKNRVSPEARMQDVLGSTAFESRLRDMQTTISASGSPDIQLLTLGEAVAINGYTRDDYKNINALLLGIFQGSEDDIRKLKIQIDETKKALDKLPNYPANPLNRAEARWKGDIGQYKAGTVFSLPAFWSTTVSKIGGSVVLPLTAPRWQITIFAKSGKSVAPVSKMPTEYEVLFKPGTKFKVKSCVLGEYMDRPSGKSSFLGKVVVEEV